jgi:hypothetical protein
MGGGLAAVSKSDLNPADKGLELLADLGPAQGI